MVTESIFIPFAEGELLHVKRFYVDANAPALLLIPGSIENGHIFYSKSGKGFAPWMAERGFDVFVADLRGRGTKHAQNQPGIEIWTSEALKRGIPRLFRQNQGDQGDQ
jgi:predicted alpha/beta hydrolase